MSFEDINFKKKLNNLEDLLNLKKFSQVEKIIKSFDKKLLEDPKIQFLYATSKAQNPNSSYEDKLNSLKIFVHLYEKSSFLPALQNASILSLEVKRFSQVLNLIENTINKIKYDPILFDCISKIYSQLGDIEKSFKYLKIKIKNEPHNLKAWSAFIFSYNYFSDFNQKKYLYYTKQFYKKLKEFDSKELVPLKTNLSKKIKIGFLTPHFTGNSIDPFLLSVVKNIDRENFETFGFNLNISNDQSDHLKTFFDEWHHVNKYTDLELTNYIREKSLDILIDLVGHGPGNRLNVLKQRVAKKQVSWLGYCNSTGLSEIDYIISDKYLIYENEQNQYSEKIFKIKSIWNSHIGHNTSLPINDLPYFKNDYFTFGSFNNFKKISEKTINIWSKILDNSNSKLILKSSIGNSPEARQFILKKFPKKFHSENKIIFMEGQVDKNEHLKKYNLVDLSLDTFPYNGVTTSFESIWMGVPILTIKGNNFISRCGESIINNLGLNEFISKNEEEYILKAIDFTKNPEKLNILRKNLRSMATKTPLFQSKEYCKNFEKAINYITEKNV